jgi:deoxyribonucleoside regulator
MPHVQPGSLKAHTVVTLSGGFSQPGHDTSVYNISWPLADALGANLEQLYCPRVAQSSAAREMIVNDPNTQAQIKSAAECDIALVSVGVVDKQMPLYRLGFCEAEDIENLQRAGAVGEMIVSFFDDQGTIVTTDLDKRIIGLTIDELHNIPTTVAISGGPEKVEALVGALHVGCIDVLITDQETAKAILELDQQTT